MPAPPAVPSRRPSIASFALLVASLAGCATPAPRERDVFELELRHFVGTPRTGPLSGPLSESIGERDVTADAQTVVARVEARWIEEPAVQLGGVGEPLAPERVLVEGEGDFLALAGELAHGARLARPAPRSLGVATPDTAAERALVALFEGATAVVALAPVPAPAALPRGASFPTTVEAAPDLPRPPWSRLELELARAGDAIELALVLRARDGSGRERLVLPGAPELGGPAWALWLPAPSAQRPRAALALEIALWRAEDPVPDEVVAARERAAAELARARREAERDASPLAAGEGLSIQIASALDALARRALGRRALFHLAQATDAPLAAELALIAAEEDLEDLRAELAAELSADQARALPAAELGWRIEAGAWGWLARRALAGDAYDPEAALLAPELVALLLSEAGALGRQPDLLLDALEECGERAALERVLVEENGIALESSEPAERVRAHDWLARRGLAVSGYDPLGERGARRAALRRLADAEQAAAEAASALSAADTSHATDAIEGVR